MLTDPTPIPADIADREYYSFHVLIEGVKLDPAIDHLREADRLKQSLLGTLAKSYPDRWSSVVRDPIGEGMTRRG